MEMSNFVTFALSQKCMKYAAYNMSLMNVLRLYEEEFDENALGRPSRKKNNF